MKVLLLLAMLAVLASCQAPLQQTQYNWVGDMVRLWIDYLIITLTNPFYFFVSFFFNNQESYYAHVNTFMHKKGFRLSYTYM